MSDSMSSLVPSKYKDNKRGGEKIEQKLFCWFCTPTMEPICVNLYISSAEELKALLVYLKGTTAQLAVPANETEVYPEDFENNAPCCQMIVETAIRTGLVHSKELLLSPFAEYVKQVQSPPELDSYCYKPSPAFKTFCGAEYCNKDALISLRSAEQSILQYAQLNKLEGGGMIHVDEVLAEALNTNEAQIPKMNLIGFLRDMFTQKV